MRAALVGALAYFVLPFDVVPDVLPLLGYTDDAAVLLTALRMVAGHMRPEHREAARDALERASGQRRSVPRLDHQLAHGLAVGERLDRLRRLGERIDLLDVARELALARTSARARSIAAW